MDAIGLLGKKTIGHEILILELFSRIMFENARTPYVANISTRLWKCRFTNSKRREMSLKTFRNQGKLIWRDWTIGHKEADSHKSRMFVSKLKKLARKFERNEKKKLIVYDLSSV